MKKNKSLSKEARKFKKLLKKNNKITTLGIIALYIILAVTGFAIFQTGNEALKFVYSSCVVPSCSALLIYDLKETWGKK